MCKVKKYKNTSNTRIDKCMKEFVEWLNLKHRVVACCCGHSKYPKTIVVKEIFKEGIPYRVRFLEIFSQIEIPRKRNFYKRDKQGYYFIPEVLFKLDIV